MLLLTHRGNAPKCASGKNSQIKLKTTITTQTTVTTFMMGAGANWLNTHHNKQTTITRTSQ